jgi:membrane-associated phospholipid phosphatase
MNHTLTIKSLYRHLKKFFLSAYKNRIFIALVIFGCFPLFWIEKGAEVIFINRFANSFADVFYIAISELGKGYIWTPVIIVFLFTKFADAFLAAIVFALNGLFSFLFKFVLFQGYPRPMSYLSAESFSHLIDGFTYFSYNSFPSGHTMTAFSIAFFLVSHLKHTRIALMIFIIAGLIGFSRIYLLLHFYEDVYAGAVLGGVCYYLGKFFSVQIMRTQKQDGWEKNLKMITMRNAHDNC